ncbi:MAG: LPS assembly protein LptD [Candidatus Accumulibacter sp.]|nr:LPS assembly protein LptD [Accumulibacter sp.]
MTFTPRRKPLTLIFCCSFAGTLAASFAEQAQGQGAAPFRVDPVLLGLPPVKPVAAPAAADRPVAETRPVQAPAVATQPVQLPVEEAATTAGQAELRQPSAGNTLAPVQLPVESAVPLLDPPHAPRTQATRPVPVEEASPTAADGELSQPPADSTVAPVEPPVERAAPLLDPHLVHEEAVPVAPPAAASAASETARPALPPQAAGVGVAPGQARRSATPPATASPSLPRALVPAERAADAGALALRIAEAIVPPVASSQPRPIFLSAQRISGVIDRELLAEGDAELRKVGKVITADRLTYWPVDDEVEGAGNVRLEQGDDVIFGPLARLKLEDQVGFFDQATYFLKRQANPGAAKQAGKEASSQWAAAATDEDSTTGFAPPRVLSIKPGQTRLKTQNKPANELTEARGEAERIDLEGENQIRMTAATYTTCKPGNDDWYLGFSELRLDYDNEVGSGDDATVHFLGVPILYSPWASFPLNNERKSGFLTPRYGSSSDNGFDFVLPYYWNIAPNMDATISPRLLSKRGLLLGTDFRYLNAAYGGSYRGEAVAEYLPQDRETGTDRWGVTLQHNQTSAMGLSGAIDYTRVSDNDYYTDLSSQITNTAKTQLLQQGLLTYGGGGWWTATANVQSYQTLQPDPKNPVAKPYRLFPQITVNARQPDLLSTDSAFFGQYTDFVHPDNNKVEGQRSVLQPQVSLPYVTPGWYVIPRAGVNFTHYQLSYPGSLNVLPTSINRTLPIVSVDSGMTFERPSNWFGRDYTQTLEPRLFYLNIPYVNQSNIPIFDTALADFNFAQIFADNQFSGWDRINNANQLTAAVASRLVDPASGSEIMRAMIGEVFYFTNDTVSLPYFQPGTQPGTAQRKWDKSDLLAAFSGQLWPRLYADAAVQYDINDQRFQRYSIGTRYVPGAGKVLNAGYRYNVDAATPINEVDVSGQWPISGRWQAVGRYNYSFINATPVEIIGGLEYNAGCWALRTVAHRIQTTQTDSTTQFFVQLDLNGLSSIGTNPLTVLQRRIPGYSMGQAATDQALAEW